jgi:Protein of unknown function (DUF2612)
MINWQATLESEYANSPTIVQLLNNMNDYIDPTNNINAFFSMIWNVDTAVGYGLDVWGRIVGVSRQLKVQAFDYFGFQGPSGASGVPWNQGIFYNGTIINDNFELQDGAYRVLILAKALFNICNGTIQAINQILINLFGANGPLPVPGNAYVTDGEDMTMTYSFGGALNPVQAAIVFNSGVLPKPAGVSATVVQR